MESELDLFSGESLKPIPAIPVEKEKPIEVEESKPETPEPTIDQLQAEADKKQSVLFEIPQDWEEKWKGMPACEQKDLQSFQSVRIHFANRKDRQRFAELIGQTVTDLTRSLWYPKAEIGRIADKHYKSETVVNPRYPIYIISKGRWESRLTSKSLEKIGVPYMIVVEPQELEKYSAVIAKEKILVTPFSNLGQGSIPVRNFVWEHSVARGDARHWILDDNIDGFYRLNKNLKVPVSTGSTFRAAEDFADRYLNVALCGFNYFMFAPRKTKITPFTLNTRIYSCILIKNNILYRWRGRYNEDTDLSIRVLKDGLCTVLFNAFLAMKQTTMTMKGGNTDELYQGDGRLKMAESLKEQHPGLVEITQKWGRYQHSVNYWIFRKNKLLLDPKAKIPEGVDDYGMELEMKS